MSKEVVFRSSLGGYNKKDVNDYLVARARETKELIEKKNAAIDGLKSDLRRLREEEEGVRDALKGEVRVDAGELSCGIGSLRALVDGLIGELEAAEAELANMSVYRAKAEKFDRFASSLSDIFSIDQSAYAPDESYAPEKKSPAFRERAEAEFSDCSALLERLASRLGE